MDIQLVKESLINLETNLTIILFTFPEKYSKDLKVILNYTRENLQECNEDEKELENNFDKLWKLYPKKKGKLIAFKHYKSWINGRKYINTRIKLTNKDIQDCIMKYLQECKNTNRDYKYMMNGSTFFNNAIADYYLK